MIRGIVMMCMAIVWTILHPMLQMSAQDDMRRDTLCRE
jgi:hypothetical protein